MDLLKIDTSKENGVPTRVVASFCGIDSDTVRDLEDRGLLASETIKGKKYYPLMTSVQEYCEYLRRQAKGTPDTDDDMLRRVKADADLKEAKAAIEQLKKAEFEGVMHRSEDVEKAITGLATAVRSELIALPGMLAVDVAATSSAQEAAGIIKAAVNNILNSLTDYQYDPSEFKKMVREREKWMNEETDRDQETE